MHWIYALPRRSTRRIVTTDGEFLSLRRQLLRLQEDGWTIIRVPATPEATVGQRIAAALTPDTSAVMASAVFYMTGKIAGGLPELAAAARALDVPLLIDAYHVLGTMQARCDARHGTTATTTFVHHQEPCRFHWQPMTCGTRTWLAVATSTCSWGRACASFATQGIARGVPCSPVR